ncbi:MAG: hypothetical protein DRG20_05075 [Deltaproteobacteria bacterium]|nr:MAG: hypothetical protein DRG20_05075 [Deltaproteobacteria bacterium]
MYRFINSPNKGCYNKNKSNIKNNFLRKFNKLKLFCKEKGEDKKLKPKKRRKFVVYCNFFIKYTKFQSKFQSKIGQKLS